MPINPNSILDSTKQVLGIEFDYTAFDLDIVMHINTVFTTLTQLGIGPVAGFAIEDNTTEWSAFLNKDFPPAKFNMVKTYVYKKVQSYFDPPATSFALAANDKMLQEMEWRLNSVAELEHVPSSATAGGYVWDLTGGQDFPPAADSGDLGVDTSTDDVWEKL